MPVIKPGKPEGQKIKNDNVDFTFIVPKGAIVKIEYEE